MQHRGKFSPQTISIINTNFANFGLISNICTSFLVPFCSDTSCKSSVSKSRATPVLVGHAGLDWSQITGKTETLTY